MFARNGLLLLLISFPFGLFAASQFIDKPMLEWTTKYDRYFKKYSKRYFGPQFNWRWFKAQGIAESNLKNRVKSHVGAVGVMQIMPATFSDIKKRNPHFSHLESPQWNIAAGIFYDRILYRKIRKPLATRDRLLFTFASYNAGYARVLRAFKKAKAYDWESVKHKLPGETRFYVARIVKLMESRNRKLRGIEKTLVSRKFKPLLN